MAAASGMRLRLQDIESLAEELRSAVRAGVPLERSLSAAAAGHGRRLRIFLQHMQGQLEAGESLESILSGTRGGASSLLAAAVAAGLKSGRPALTLELLGDYATDVIELRSRIAQAATYPVAVMATAVLLVMGGLQLFLDRYLESVVAGSGVQPGALLMGFLLFNHDNPWWVFVPASLFAGLIVLWILSGRSTALSFRGPERLLLLLPGLSRIVDDLRSYTLTRMLWLLLQHEISLTEALPLAGAVSGSGRLQRACVGLAAEVSEGRTSASAGSSAAAHLPPLLRASLDQTAGHEQRLVLRLQATAGFYRQRFERGVMWMRLLMPAVLLCVIGGGCAIGYGLLIFWPVLELYRGLAATVMAPVNVWQSALAFCQEGLRG
ncbi:MAG: ral secretion pathway protein [Planctomycetota bacterium]